MNGPSLLLVRPSQSTSKRSFLLAPACALAVLCTLPLQTSCMAIPEEAAAASSIADYDNLIVPGVRVGPVALGGSVKEIMAKIGQPSSSKRWRGVGGHDEVRYTYDRHCLKFTWADEGLDPQVERGLRGIHATCSRWHTAEGIHVGSSIQDVVNAYGPPHATLGNCDGRDVCMLGYSNGLRFQANDRNSPIVDIWVNPATRPGATIGF